MSTFYSEAGQAAGLNPAESVNGAHQQYLIGKRFNFAAARRGHGGALVGRTFEVEVELTSSTLSGPGFVCDFADLSPLKAYIQRTWDHRVLEDVVDWEPSNTGLAAHFGHWFRAHVKPSLPASLCHVRVWEDMPVTHTSVPRWWFGAAHHLPSLPATHKCSRPHGHSYFLDVTLSGGTPSARACALTELATYVDTRLHDHDLNVVLDVEPTSEYLAAHLGRVLLDSARGSVRVEAVTVWESRRSWAMWSPEAPR